MTVPAALTRLTKLAAEVIKAGVLSDQAHALLKPDHTPRDFFNVLQTEPELAEDAIRFLAAALPKREAVWWAIRCVRSAHVPAGPVAPEAVKAIAASDAWVKEPTEARRRACGEAASTADYGTTAGCLAAAAYWSGGTFAPPCPIAGPSCDDFTATATSAAVLLAAAAQPDPTAAHSKFVALGADILSGVSHL